MDETDREELFGGMSMGMTDREKLNLASKADLIDAILQTNDRRLIANIKHTIIGEYQKKMEDILEKQEACDLWTPGGRQKYWDLEKQYEKLEKTFKRLVGG